MVGFGKWEKVSFKKVHKQDARVIFEDFRCAVAVMWVVVGADAQTMLAQGFQPVGKDFPVFLHPDTHRQKLCYSKLGGGFL